MMIYKRDDILNFEQRYRATFLNSLAGFRQVVLVGTKSEQGNSNLAIFNSILHIGAHPPYYGLIFRPDTVRRDTLVNILERKDYTFNYVNFGDFKKAHQTAAKYENNESEFEAVGFTEYFDDLISAPFVNEAPIKIGMKFEEKIDISINGTIMIIGSVQSVEIDESIISKDGFIALHEEHILACAGLDAYYRPEFIGRLSYAKPNINPEKI